MANNKTKTKRTNFKMSEDITGNDDEILEQIVNEHKKSEEKAYSENCDLIAEMNPEALLADGYEKALIGYDKEGRAVYDAHECLSILVWRDGMSAEEAEEFFEFNTLSAYMGENTPQFIWLFNSRDNYIDLCNEYVNHE